MNNRVYFDWNATAPLKQEAKTAMIGVMNELGNPSSIHAEGRAAKSVVEKAREQISEVFGAGSSEIIFTSGATEAAKLALNNHNVNCAALEHPCILSNCENNLEVSKNGQVLVVDPDNSSVQSANSETGILQKLHDGIYLTDFVQSFCKIPTAFDWSGCKRGMLSAHKIGGPKGVGALVIKKGEEVQDLFNGGGQESGRRSGTENIVGIAGFGAAAVKAQKDLQEGVWEKVSKLRNLLEEGLEAIASEAIFIGRGLDRLPNTCCFSVPGWVGETAVMQMDIAGYAISAGSACSSGVVKKSSVLESLGYESEISECAIRVSLGPDNTEEEISKFIDVWGSYYRRFKAKAA